MRSWGYKIKHELFMTLRKKWRGVLSFWFAILGAFFTISEIMDSVFELQHAYLLLRANFASLIIISLIVSVLLNWIHLQHSCFLSDTDIKITLLVGDVLKQKSAVVIPTNSTFDTLMDNEFISIKSVQGQFQNNHYQNNLEQLNILLENSLRNKPYITLNDNRKTKAKRYEIGTVCKLSIERSHIYFLAVANINRFGKPENTTIGDITTSLVNLWQCLNIEGHLEALSIPLVGTGRAGVKDALRDVIIKEIIFSFIAAAREMKITEDLRICIHPSDFSQKNLHWSDMCDYLDYMCKFKYSEKISVVTGNPEGDSTVHSKMTDTLSV